MNTSAQNSLQSSPCIRLPIFVATLVALLLSLFPLGSVWAQDDAVQAIAQAINAQRANAGLPPLNLHPLLNQAAQNHVNDMIANHIYGHGGSDGSSTRQRVERVGYASGGWVSENWVSANSPEGAMQWWMNDWIHRENILNPHWREFGVGVGVDPNGGMIFVTDFTAGSDGNYIAVANVNQNDSQAAEPLAVPAGGIDYTIQSGDTLLAIAYRYGLDWVVIAEDNKINGETLLQIGQTIHLPGVQGVGGQVENKADANVAGQPAAPEQETAPQTTASQTTTEASTTGFTRLYTVQPGNTLVDIAQIYDITWEELAAASNLGEDSVLAIGQELRIPDKAQPTATAAPEVQAAAAQADTAQADAKQADVKETPRTHKVKSGETIMTIAAHYGLDWQDLLRLNDLSDDSILQPDQKIRLR